MNSSTDLHSCATSQPADGIPLPQASPDPAQDERTTLFADDLGQLPLETRRLLLQLLSGPSLDAQRQTKLWPVLLRDERVIRSRLHELFLELVIDREQQVAFTRQVIADSVEVPTLLRKASLTFIQSALVLFLREQLIQAEARGERAVVSRDEMVEQLGVFEAEGSRDQAKFLQQAGKAVERAKELNLLRKLRGGEERYEVSPTLKLLFSAEQIQSLTRTYARLRESGGRSLIDQAEPECEDA
jgi:hypothetical protein